MKYRLGFYKTIHFSSTLAVMTGRYGGLISVLYPNSLLSPLMTPMWQMCICKLCYLLNCHGQKLPPSNWFYAFLNIVTNMAGFDAVGQQRAKLIYIFKGLTVCVCVCVCTVLICLMFIMIVRIVFKENYRSINLAYLHPSIPPFPEDNLFVIDL